MEGGSYGMPPIRTRRHGSSSTSSVTIVLVGDRGVGKSSLLATAIHGEFQESVPAKLPAQELPLPVVGRMNVSALVIDTSLRVQQEDDIDVCIRQADVVCIVCSVDDQDIMARVGSFWLPFVAKACEPLKKDTPILILANKMDAHRSLKTSHFGELCREIMPFLDMYPNIDSCKDSCVECTALDFASAQRALTVAYNVALFPVSPLYDHKSKQLTRATKRAFSRVFWICDQDKNDLLSNEELVQFQEEFFGSPLSDRDVANIKKVVSLEEEDGVVDDSISLKGFLFLQKRFIQKGRADAAWTVLRAFGYDNELRLTKSYSSPSYKLAADGVPEITPSVHEFLVKLFHLYDRGNKGHITSAEIEEMFDVCDSGIPWEEDVYPFNNEITLTVDQYLCLWMYVCIWSPAKYLQALAYMGFNFHNSLSNDNAHRSFRSEDAIKTTTTRSDERAAGVSTRTVHVCYLFGKKGCGKTTLIESLAAMGTQSVLGYSTLHRSALGSVQIRGSRQYLLGRENAVNSDDDDVLSSPSLHNVCDVVVLCYDTTDPLSFNYAIHLMDKLSSSKCRVVIVATKCDLEHVPQQSPQTPQEYCKQRRIPLLKLSTKEIDQLNTVEAIIKVAKQPAPSTIGDTYVGTQGKGSFAMVAAVTATVAACVVAGFLLHRYLSPPTPTPK